MEFEKKIAVLGSTGSIGTQTLEIAPRIQGYKNRGNVCTFKLLI